MSVIMVHSHGIFGDEIPSAVTLKFLTSLFLLIADKTGCVHLISFIMF